MLTAVVEMQTAPGYPSLGPIGAVQCAVLDGFTQVSRFDAFRGVEAVSYTHLTLPTIYSV